MLRTKILEKIKTGISCSIYIYFFRKSCLLWDNGRKNIVQPSRLVMTMWRMRIAFWIPEATSAHSEYVILLDFPLLQWLLERISVLRYTYLACLVFSYLSNRNFIKIFCFVFVFCFCQSRKFLIVHLHWYLPWSAHNQTNCHTVWSTFRTRESDAKLIMFCVCVDLR